MLNVVVAFLGQGAKFVHTRVPSHLCTGGCCTLWCTRGRRHCHSVSGSKEMGSNTMQTCKGTTRYNREA